jgi:hypothetical protein
MNFQQDFCRAPLIPLKLEDLLVYASDKDKVKLKKNKLNTAFKGEIYSTIVSVLRSPLLEWDSNTKPIIDEKFKGKKK